MPCRQRNRPTTRRPPASWRAGLGRQLYATVRICVILALLCTVIGVVLMFALCAIGAFDSATVGNLLVYMGLWLVPVILLNFSLKR